MEKTLDAVIIDREIAVYISHCTAESPASLGGFMEVEQHGGWDDFGGWDAVEDQIRRVASLSLD